MTEPRHTVEPPWLLRSRERIKAAKPFKVGSDIHLLEMAVAAYEAMPTPRVLVQIDGGLISEVHVDGAVEYLELDWDNITQHDGALSLDIDDEMAFQTYSGATDHFNDALRVARVSLEAEIAKQEADEP